MLLNETNKRNVPYLGVHPIPYMCIFWKRGSGIHIHACVHHAAAWVLSVFLVVYHLCSVHIHACVHHEAALAEVKSVFNTLTSQHIWPVSISRFNNCIWKNLTRITFCISAFQPFWIHAWCGGVLKDIYVWKYLQTPSALCGNIYRRNISAGMSEESPEFWNYVADCILYKVYRQRGVFNTGS